MKEGWSFKQRFSLRAGTMLLSFCCLLVVLAYVEPLYNAIGGGSPWLDEILWRFGVNFERYLLISAGFSLLFLGRSVTMKEPQAQFLLELILAGLLYQLF